MRLLFSFPTAETSEACVETKFHMIKTALIGWATIWKAAALKNCLGLKQTLCVKSVHDFTLKIILKQFLRFHGDANGFSWVSREVPLIGCISLGSQSKPHMAIEHQFCCFSDFLKKYISLAYCVLVSDLCTVDKLLLTNCSTENLIFTVDHLLKNNKYLFSDGWETKRESH